MISNLVGKSTGHSTYTEKLFRWFEEFFPSNLSKTFKHQKQNSFQTNGRLANDCLSKADNRVKCVFSCSERKIDRDFRVVRRMLGHGLCVSNERRTTSGEHYRVVKQLWPSSCGYCFGMLYTARTHTNVNRMQRT